MGFIQVDFKMMCENAMIYNKPDTIYHKAARKLLHSGMKILSQVCTENKFMLCIGSSSRTITDFVSVIFQPQAK